MSNTIQGAGQLQTFSLADLGLRKEAEKLIQKETVETADGKVEAHVFDNQSDALKYASQHAGDEAVTKLEDGRWAVLDLKSSYAEVTRLDAGTTEKDQNHQLKIKADALFDPDAAAHFPDRAISRARVYESGSGAQDAKMDRIELIRGAAQTPDRQVESSLRLAKIALAGDVGGFDARKATNTVKGEQYTTNLSTAVTGLNTSIETLEAKYKAAEAEVKKGLEAKEKAAQGEGVADPWIDDKLKNLQNLGSQLEELKTYRGLLRNRLLTSAESNAPVPGLTNAKGEPVKIGDKRNAFGDVREMLQQRKAQLQDSLAKATSPEAKASLQGQIDLIDKEYVQTNKSENQVQAAEIAIRMRVGALATTSKALGDASASLQVKSQKLVALNDELIRLSNDPNQGPQGPRQKVPEVRRQLEQLKKEIETEKAALVATMETEAKSFGDHAPRGAKAKEFLVSQIAEVKALNLSDPAQSKAEIAKLNAIQANLLPQIKKDAKIWEGISPKEGSLLEQIDTKVNTYISDYKQAKQDASKLEARVKLAEQLPDFAYTRAPIKSVADARDKWTPGSTGQSGVDANKIINETYDHLDKQFEKYMGEPQIANWMTFGKYASREAGTQIQNLEAALEALETFKKIDGSPDNDARAAQALVKVMRSDRMLEQSIRMALDVSKDVSSADLGDLVLKGLVGTGAEKGAEFAGRMIGALENLRGAMVKGNTRIYENVVAPYDVFMAAEQKGENGLDALKKAGYNGPHAGQVFTTATQKDPQGFVIQAFTKYKEAKTLSDKVEILRKEDPVGNKAEIDKLLERRKNITHEANLLIGMQEQLTILQDKDIFGNPQVSRLLNAMTGTMSLNDANGRHELLPGLTPAKASWADFKTRMGLEDVPAGTPGAIKAVMPDKSTHYFVPKYPAGTISQYFRDGLEGADAAKLVKSPPRDISPIYRDSVEGKVTTMDRLEDATLVVAPVVWVGKQIYDIF